MEIPRIAAAGRSLATGTLLGLRRGEPGRLRRLEATALAGALGQGDPARSVELDRLAMTAGIAALQRMMADGRITSEELTAHLLARALRLDPMLNCLIALNAAALEEARAADARRAAGAVGPLLGIPVTVKDNIETAGMPTTAGAAILADHASAADAPVVTALRAAGAVILGKANLSELAGAAVRTPGFSAVGGQTVNPHGAGFTPGGSSSGSAVSVAAGLAPLSVGTETSGSLLAPASFNGVVGMKPSRGVLDTAGIVPLARHQDSAGPLARTVADAAALLHALSGGKVAADLSAAPLDGVRVGVLRDDILTQRTPSEDTTDNPEVLARIEAGLRAAGADLVPTSVAAAEGWDSLETDLLTVVLGGLTHDTVGYLVQCDVGVGSLADLHAFNLRDPRRRMPKGQFFLDLALARNVSREAYQDAAQTLGEAAARTLGATFEDAGVDVLASVTNLHSPLYASAGYPAVAVPLGLRTSGMPTAVTLIGRLGSDAALLGWAHAFESASGLQVAPDPG